MTSARDWWRRVTAAVKDKHSVYMTMVSLSRRRRQHRSHDMEAAVIRATSHSERYIDYKNAGRVFAWARTSPSFMSPLMWAIACRAECTHSWPVALKCLLLAHGLLLISPISDTYNGRLPFDLGDFRDRSSSNSWGFSAFIRAYFQFLDNRAILLSSNDENKDDSDCGMNQVDRLQTLLDLLMQIRPYADGMDTVLILEAMDCAVIEIFEVYSGICNGIASFLVGVLGSNSNSKTESGEEERKRRGLKAISVLKRASEQSVQLTNYLEVCRSLGVLNAIEFIPVDRIPDEDIMDLEKLVLLGTPGIEEKPKEKENCRAKEEEEEEKVVMMDLIQLEEEEVVEEKKDLQVVPLDWVVFEDEFRSSVQGYYSNPFVYAPTERQWATMVHCNGGTATGTPWTGNLIELM